MNLDIKRSADRVGGIHELLTLAEYSQISLGIPFLNEALVGLLPNDLCLIGAKTGRGKTQMCLEIAKSAASSKKKVVFIALEAEPQEVEMRLYFQIVAGLYFKDPHRDKTVVCNYRNWRLGLLSSYFIKYDAEAEDIFKDKYSTLTTVYRQQSFTVDDLYKVLEMTKHGGDLIILDHLHYIDIDLGRDQHQATGLLMKAIRDLNIFFNKPFVVAAHLRKDIDGLLPATEDFMGSSDIGKQSTVSIMIAANPQGYDAKEQISQTLISIPKARTGGLGNLCGVLDYSLRHQLYLPRFKLASIMPMGNKVEMLKEEDYPEWARQTLK